MSELTILSLNAGMCRVFGVMLGKSLISRTRLIRDALAELQPDVVCLQEMWDDGLTAESLAGLAGHRMVRAHRRSWRTPMGSGLAISTRLPVREVSFRPFCHTYRLKEMLALRGLLTAMVEHDGMPLAVSSTHLGVGPTWRRRRQHADFIASVGQIAPPHIVCGDFNLHTAEAERLGFATLAELAQLGFNDVLAAAHGQERADAMVTVDRANPLVRPGHHERIDYVWARPCAGGQIEVHEARLAVNKPVEGLYPSDHYGVFARMNLGMA